LTRLIWSLALIMVIKNLGRHSLPPLRRISSRDSKLQEELGKWFWDRGVTHRVKLIWLSLKNWVLAGSTLSCSEVLILMREIWAITSEMPGLSTMVAQTRWNVSGLGDLLRGFLDKAEPVPLLFPCPLRGSRRCCTSRELSGLVSITSSFAFTRTSFLTGNFPLTYIYLR
jgi:hypothetical protein